MLKTANLSYKFDDKYIFSNLSFEFANDSVFKLVGDNGSGKSTLLKILSGIYKNYEGELSFPDDNLVFYSGHKTGLKNNLSPRENIYFDIRLPEISHSQINSVLLVHSNLWKCIDFFPLKGKPFSYTLWQKQKEVTMFISNTCSA